MLTLDLTMKLNRLRSLFEGGVDFCTAVKMVDGADCRAALKRAWRQWEAFNEGLPF